MVNVIKVAESEEALDELEEWRGTADDFIDKIKFENKGGVLLSDGRCRVLISQIRRQEIPQGARPYFVAPDGSVYLRCPDFSSYCSDFYH